MAPSSKPNLENLPIPNKHHSSRFSLPTPPPTADIPAPSPFQAHKDEFITVTTAVGDHHTPISDYSTRNPFESIDSPKSVWSVLSNLNMAESFFKHQHDHHDHKHTHTHKHDHKHTHNHSHAPHKHDHHEHNTIQASHLTKFLLAQTTPNSIIHTILSEKDTRRIAYFGVLNLGFMFVQFFYGYVTGSLGLLTDSVHMMFDCIGLAVGLAAAVMAKWPPSLSFPYGYTKVESLSGFANGILLILVSLEIISDAWHRLQEGAELQRLDELLVVSVLGLLVNIVGLTAFGHAHHGHDHDHDHDHANENMQGIFLHVLADALGSVAVIVSTLLTKYNSWNGWDPLASVLIAIAISISAVPLIRSAGWNLMVRLGGDAEWKVKESLRGISGIKGVVGYAGVRVWLEGEGQHQHKHKDEDDHEHCHSNGHSHGHDDHAHQVNHRHGHQHEHDHRHSHEHESKQFTGSMHIIAGNSADLEDVRKRAEDFLREKGFRVTIHVERQSETKCWCRTGTGNWYVT